MRLWLNVGRLGNTASQLFNSRGNTSDVLTLVGGTAFSQLVLIAGLPVLTRLYEPAEFGAFALAHTLSIILVVLLTFRAEAVIIYEPDSSAALRCVKAVLVYALIVCAMIILLVAVFFGLTDGPAPAGNRILFFISPMLALLFGLAFFLRNWLVRKRRTNVVAFAYGARGPVFVLIAVSAAFTELRSVVPGGVLLLSAQLVAELACFVVAASGLRAREVSYLWRVPLSRIWSAVATQRGAFLASFGSQIILQLSDRLPLLIVGSAFGPAAAGIFSLAERVVAAPFQLISTAVIDVFNRQAGDEWKRVGRFDHVIRGWMRNLLLFSTAPFVAMIIVFLFFTDLLFGQRWSAAWFTLCVLSIWSFGYFNFRVFDRWFVPTGRYFFFFAAIGTRLAVIVALGVMALFGIIAYPGFVMLFAAISFAVDVIVVIVGLRESRGREKSV